jgi:hypothetical protein
MYFCSSVAEIVGYASCHLNDFFSRKKVFIGFLGSASLMCLIVALIPTSDSKQRLIPFLSYCLLQLAKRWHQLLLIQAMCSLLNFIQPV